MLLIEYRFIKNSKKERELLMGKIQSVQSLPIGNAPTTTSTLPPRITTDCETYVVDACCGAGKTSGAINFINDYAKNDPNTRFLYITPFLSEVQRIRSSCEGFVEPDILGTKLDGMRHLLGDKRNIVSTHALFIRFDQECLKLTRASDYILILDEVADVVQPYPITQSDVDLLLSTFVDLGEDGVLHWREGQQAYSGKLIEYKNLCDLGCLTMWNGKIFLWMFPVGIFKAFKQVYILTYMFEAQIQSLYYKFFGVKYSPAYIVGAYPDCRFTFEPQTYDERKMKDLIHILDNDRMNEIGEGNTALSKTWYTQKDKDASYWLSLLQRNTANFFANIMNTPSGKAMWTTFKPFKNRLKGKGYTKGFLACNARATNEYAEKTTLAYLVNVFLNPFIKMFFQNHGITVNEDLYALSELIQWIFRSQIRNGKPINIYLPSRRMRGLLQEWKDANCDSNNLCGIHEQASEYDEDYTKDLSTIVQSYEDEDENEWN